MFDIVISCVYISYALQPWIAVIVRSDKLTKFATLPNRHAWHRFMM